MKIRMLCVTRYSTKVLNILLQKADKRALDNLISRSKFDQSIGGLEQSMQELLHRLDGQVGSTRHKFLYHLRFNLFFDSPFIVSSSLLISENLDMVWKYHQTNLKKNFETSGYSSILLGNFGVFSLLSILHFAGIIIKRCLGSTCRRHWSETW